MLITRSITGISITSDEFIPATRPDTGRSNGFMATAAPLTSTRLKILAPMIFPRDSEP